MCRSISGERFLVSFIVGLCSSYMLLTARAQPWIVQKPAGREAETGFLRSQNDQLDSGPCSFIYLKFLACHSNFQRESDVGRLLHCILVANFNDACESQNRVSEMSVIGVIYAVAISPSISQRSSHDCPVFQRNT